MLRLRSRLRLLSYLLVGLSLVGCASSVAPSIVSLPTQMRPLPQAPMSASNGAIYQAEPSRLLFEDKVARMLGDTLIIVIEEQIAAATSSGNKAERTSSVSNVFDASASASLFSKALSKSALKNDVSNSFEGKGQTTANNTFSGSIAATVVELLANGNFLVAGEKQINIRGELSQLRISGIVDPNDIQSGNRISSTRLVDARIEEVGSGTVAAAEKAGWLQRFFLSVMPF